MVFGRNKNKENMEPRKIIELKPIPQREYFDPVREAIEQQVKRQITLKHKAGDMWRARHVEELVGVLRDPDTPPEAKTIVRVYVEDWEELDKVVNEIEECEADITASDEEKNPLSKEKYELDLIVLKRNKRLRISRLAKLFRLLNANKIFPQGIEIVGEEEYREFGVGKVLAVSPSALGLKKKSKQPDNTTVGADETDQRPAAGAE